MNIDGYEMVVSKLSNDDGGGYLVTFPDLVGCIADGETEEKALEQAKAAYKEWKLAELEDKGLMP